MNGQPGERQNDWGALAIHGPITNQLYKMQYSNSLSISEMKNPYTHQEFLPHIPIAYEVFGVSQTQKLFNAKTIQNIILAGFAVDSLGTFLYPHFTSFISGRWAALAVTFAVVLAVGHPKLNLTTSATTYCKSQDWIAYEV